MQTTLTIRTDGGLRDEAKQVANALGVPLTTVVNALLKQFVRERSFSVQMEPAPTREKLALWGQISAEMDASPASPSFSRAQDLVRHLKLG